MLKMQFSQLSKITNEFRKASFPAGTFVKLCYFQDKINIMYKLLIQAHSYNRYIILILLLAVIVKALSGWLGKKVFDNGDNKVSLFLLIFTHIQLLLGLVLYFISPWVKFSSGTMKDHDLRYWTVEHIFGMLIAVALITVGRITMKKMTSDEAKHKRLFIFNLIALVIIIAVIFFSGRGLLKSTY